MSVPSGLTCWASAGLTASGAGDSDIGNNARVTRPTTTHAHTTWRNIRVPLLVLREIDRLNHRRLHAAVEASAAWPAPPSAARPAARPAGARPAAHQRQRKPARP